MKLTNLNLDCLEAVLDHLKIVDLLNVADASTRLRNAAKLVYARSHSEKVVVFEELYYSSGVNIFKYAIRDDRYVSHSMEKYVAIDKNAFGISDYKIAFQLMRTFGHLVSNLIFDIRNKPLSIPQLVDYEIDVRLLKYINEYCSETLEKMMIRTRRTSSCFNYFKKPFKQLEQLTIDNFLNTPNGVTMAPADDCLVRLFPNMRSLSLSNHQFVSIRCIGHHFPHLEHLKIKHTPIVNHSGIQPAPFPSKEMYLAIFRLNPQLKHLVLDNLNVLYVDMQIDFTEYLENLEHFEFGGELRETNFRPMHLKSVKHLTLLTNHQTNEFQLHTTPLLRRMIWPTSLGFHTVPYLNRIICDQLESLTLFCIGRYISTDHPLIRFLQQHKSIRKLRLNIMPFFMTHQLSREISWVAKILPLLNELELLLFNFKSDELQKIIMDIVRSNATIKTFSFCWFERVKDIEYYHNHFNCDWLISLSDDGKRLTLKRQI